MAITGDRVVKLVGRALQARGSPGERPLTVLIGGTQVDLPLLLAKVKDFGGYTKASGARKWGTVATSMGLPPHCGPSVKLVYLKYLKSLESGHIFNANATKNVEASSLASTAALPEALSYLRRLALDPGNATHSAPENGEFRATVKRVLGGLRRKEEEEQHHHHHVERPGRRGVSSITSKYSLRSYRHENGQLLSLPTTKKVSIRIGPNFQAQVPAVVTGSDEDSTLFSGRVVWPQGKEVGTGSSSNSICVEGGSCVKRRIEEQRRKLKLELGEEVFREWGFNKMGESLVESAKWSRQEEAEFTAIVKECCQGDKLWPELQASFAGRRSREDLVDYFFNVFVLRKRAVQNRSHAFDAGSWPSGGILGEFDSDELLSEEVAIQNFSSLGDGFGSESTRPALILQEAKPCVKQCQVPYAVPPASGVPEAKSCIKCSC
ncbi:hypothetical protein SELMODRAFT_404866 [Selaginella moellendorffii]|uniref:ARID domain-containing protein n=1 Tax=Selaginella moellendorffii TaxID=88036 RepID=D8QXL7_SELML|nr:uncharacterized protein LOC9643401 [Selaginella moellendorffii]EFJ35444.1 hypothetical protein SELMODRAFT_404866 [Selaginella moellendorffii]|eukprot:XP_002963573.1 uncharacterized protein LOC9643401 [Selaginella moellendorffii]